MQLSLLLGSVLGYLSSYVGWYGYEKWRNRVATHSIDESKSRGVFEKVLNFQVDSFAGSLGDFKPYMERGFRYGYHSSEETVPLIDSQYPWQLGFNIIPNEKFGVFIRKDQLVKFDSSNSVWGYLKSPHLKDTIILVIRGEQVRSGQIRVWE
ncbi:hypothetical protein [Flavihumibacter petaseus]|uniref:Uncharacterized protein n=1 Tax=Flavihumibacter petaseus NBRC 106054 TaxID=1220578 RepID=A0A0E9N2P6_9BACT|nr:hypothetical protein [Flavihumibacter petaseus]GAO44119.1 hypothetical protein FPE01S_03_01580 [Flavihumibacter petaseus NBRC 106054]